jgi:hypothetical protein
MRCMRSRKQAANALPGMADSTDYRYLIAPSIAAAERL